jgi:mannose-6-phosphate isomerase-like protein (cupin superfamily)
MGNIKVEHIHEEIPDFYKVIKLHQFRKTEGVSFDILPMELLPRIDGVDRVIHSYNAVSPGPVNNIERPWYMHPEQDDFLMVLSGTRYVDIYTKEFGKVESFSVTANLVYKGEKLIYEGSVMLIWPRGVFHRIRSGENGSASLNFAVRGEGFDIKTNFNIYDLNTETGEYKVIRKGHLDQK